MTSAKVTSVAHEHTAQYASAAVVEISAPLKESPVEKSTVTTDVPHEVATRRKRSWDRVCAFLAETANEPVRAVTRRCLAWDSHSSFCESIRLSFYA
eukprot:2912040-Rhodomonas_salina.2